MTTTNAGYPVVAGVDGSPDGLASAEYAADQAALRGRPLHLLHAYRRSPAIDPLLPVAPPLGSAGAATAVAYQAYAPSFNADLMREAGEHAVAEARERALARHPNLHIETQVVGGSAAQHLVRASDRAALVVVTRNHERSVERFFTGSTTSAVAGHARCPVAVVPDNWQSLEPTGRVAVGIDARRIESGVLAYAFEQAALAKASLEVIHAWAPLERWHLSVDKLADDSNEQTRAERRAVAEQTAGWSERYPDVPFGRTYSDLSPAKALLEASDVVDLVVVGTRGSGGFPGLRFGSTARNLITHAHCPVVLVPSEDDEDDPDWLNTVGAATFAPTLY